MGGGTVGGEGGEMITPRLRVILPYGQFQYLLFQSRGLSIEAIVEVTGCAYDTVRSGLSRAYKGITKAGLSIDDTLSQLQVESGVANGTRCSVCHLLMPCRRDGLTGVCDAREVSMDEIQGLTELWDAVRNRQDDDVDPTDRKRRSYLAKKANLAKKAKIAYEENNA